MATLQAFAPAYGQGQNITVGPAHVEAGIDEYASSVRIANFNNFVVYVRVSANGAAATPADFAVGPNQTSTLSKGDAQGVISLLGTGSGVVNVIPGVGF